MTPGGCCATALANLQATEQFRQPLPKLRCQPLPAYSGAAYGSSDFLRTVSDKEPKDAWKVMDELMESLSVMQPKTYAAVMNKRNSL